MPFHVWRVRRPTRLRARRVLRPLLAGGLALAALTRIEPDAPVRVHAGQIGSARSVAECLRAARCPETFVVAHRARGFGAPENSGEAIERALTQGVQAVKVDLRASRDGAVFVLHDPTLDRTTDGRGPIAERDADELAGVHLRNGEPLPRFDALYRRFAGRVTFVLDCKAEVIEPVADWLAAEAALDGAVFLVGSIEQMRALGQARTRHPAVLVAARLVNWWDLPVIWEIFRGPPDFLHTDLTTPADLAEVRRRAPGVKLFVKALDVERRVWPLDGLALRDLVDARPELVLTSEPVRLQRWIRQRIATGPSVRESAR